MIFNKNILQFFYLLIFITPFFCHANQNVIEIVTNDYLHQKSEYEKKSLECRKKSKTLELNKSNLDDIEKMGISYSEFLKIIGHYSSRNRNVCTENEQYKLLFSLEKLKLVRELYGDPYNDVDDIRYLLIYPDIRYLEDSSEYFGISQKEKEYFDNIFGMEPFNAINTIRSIEKLRTGQND